jgi:hypothetical protein
MFLGNHTYLTKQTLYGKKIPYYDKLDHLSIPYSLRSIVYDKVFLIIEQQQNLFLNETIDKI